MPCVPLIAPSSRFIPLFPIFTHIFRVSQELRLETYLQSLIATGTARPPPAAAPALVIPPAFQAQFCEHNKDDDDDDEGEGDVEMEDVVSFSSFIPWSCAGATSA